LYIQYKKKKSNGEIIIFIINIDLNLQKKLLCLFFVYIVNFCVANDLATQCWIRCVWFTNPQIIRFYRIEFLNRNEIKENNSFINELHIPVSCFKNQLESKSVNKNVWIHYIFPFLFRIFGLDRWPLKREFKETCILTVVLGNRGENPNKKFENLGKVGKIWGLQPYFLSGNKC